MVLDFDPIKLELLKLKYGTDCRKLTRDQMKAVLGLCSLLRPDMEFPCAEVLEHWGSELVDNMYKTVNIDGFDLCFVKPSALLHLYWADPMLRLYFLNSVS